MKAVLILAGENRELHPLNDQTPVPMLPLLDRPFVQHVVESLVAQGFLEFDVLLCNIPEAIERFLGDGTRWGCTFRYHLVRDPERPYRHLRALRFGDGITPVLLAHGDRLPLLDVAAARPSEEDPGIVFFDTGKGEDGEDVPFYAWSGWAWVPSSILAEMPADLDEAGLGGFLSQRIDGDADRFQVKNLLNFNSFEGLLQANRQVMEGEGEGFLLSGRQTDPGIWISRNVSLHPMARLEPPVYIGENCRIGMGVKLGPNAVLDSDCVLDKGCTVENSLILPGSYVGQALELADVIVDRNRLVNVRVGAAVTITDDFILGSLKENRFRKWFAAAASRLTAALLLVVFSPVILLTALFLRAAGRRPAVTTRSGSRRGPSHPGPRTAHAAPHS